VLRFTEEEIKNVKYVVAEVVLKTDSTNKTRGLFLGCQPMVKANTQLVSSDEEFVWLYRDNNVYMLNVDHYNIHVLEILEEGSITSVHTVGDNHEEYMQRIRLIHKVFTDNNKVLKSGLIDVDQYTVPAKVMESLGKVDIKPVTKPMATCSYGATGSYSKSVYTSKEPSTFVMKRTSKYSATNAIDKMAAKVEEVRAGKYQPPKLPVILETVKDPPKKEADDDDFRDYYDSMGYNPGMIG